LLVLPARGQRFWRGPHQLPAGCERPWPHCRPTWRRWPFPCSSSRRAPPGRSARRRSVACGVVPAVGGCMGQEEPAFFADWPIPAERFPRVFCGVPSRLLACRLAATAASQPSHRPRAGLEAWPPGWLCQLQQANPSAPSPAHADLTAAASPSAAMKPRLGLPCLAALSVFRLTGLRRLQGSPQRRLVGARSFSSKVLRPCLSNRSGLSFVRAGIWQELLNLPRPAMARMRASENGDEAMELLFSGVSFSSGRSSGTGRPSMPCGRQVQQRPTQWDPTGALSALEAGHYL